MAENLLNFVNNASSNVKTVLSKPGCFKRNTNHRRFLQKQLRLSAQKTPTESMAKNPEGSKKTFAISKIRKSKSNRSRIFVRGATPSNVNVTQTTTFPLMMMSLPISQPQRRYNNIRGTEEGSCKNNELNTLDEMVQAHGEGLYEQLQGLDTDCQKFSAVVDQIVDNLLDSSLDFESWSLEEQRVNSHSSYSRSGSVSSNASSEDDYMNNVDFMSGEELVRSLDISDLFIPDGAASEDSMDEFKPSETFKDKFYSPSTEDCHLPDIGSVFQGFSL